MNILIVDDHAVVREGYKALLNAMMPDCRIFDAENGAQTHRLLASSDIEILILDINLSNESGSSTTTLWCVKVTKLYLMR